MQSIFYLFQSSALMPIIDVVPDVNWQHGVHVWRQFSGSDVTIPTEPTQGWQNRFEALRGNIVELIKPKPKSKTPVDGEEPPSKKRRVELRDDMPSFRVTCYRNGKKHCFQSPQAACVFGGAVQDYLQWNVKMKEYDLEVVLDINDAEVTVMIALTTQSLHRRRLTKFGRTTLRPTISYGMLRYSNVAQS